MLYRRILTTISLYALHRFPVDHGTACDVPASALHRVYSATSTESLEYHCHTSSGGCSSGRGDDEGGEEEEEEKSVRRGAVPAGVGRRIQGRQDDLARCLVPDHQDQPVQGDPVPKPSPCTLPLFFVCISFQSICRDICNAGWSAWKGMGISVQGRLVFTPSLHPLFVTSRHVTCVYTIEE
jgi:hypothetical protein